jgi:hypothetical protein
MMYVEPLHAGRTQLHLIYDGGTEGRVAWVLFGCGLLLWVAQAFLPVSGFSLLLLPV